MKTLASNPKMLFVGTYPPRECGIATFTQDLGHAINKVFGQSLPVEICALENELTFKRYYPRQVTYILRTSLVEEYRKVANAINERKDIGMVCIQHEFGLFSGEMGDALLSFMLAMNKPITTVFHTVLPHPDRKRFRLVEAICNLSEKIIVLTNNSKRLLVEQYTIPREIIEVIPHGTHVIDSKNKNRLKRKYGYENRFVLSSFGLLSENKNIETVLYALPKIIEKHPSTLYLVLGKTHPEVFKKEGEQYRNQLIELVAQLGLQKHVQFVNKYILLSELLEHLSLSDGYLFSSKDPHQAVSGTFVYAKSAGCPVVSTPIPHACELIDENSGILLDGFEKPSLFESAIFELIENKQKSKNMSNNSFSHMRASSWENVGISYGLLFADITNKAEDLSFALPEIKLSHIQRMTTDLGILQFSHFCKPNPDFGYTLDDNARALIASIMYMDVCADASYFKLAETYLDFMGYVQTDEGRFLNYVDFDRNYSKQNEQVNLEDPNGRALWALGYLFSRSNILPGKFVEQAEVYWRKAYPNITDITSPRAIAFAIKGLYFRFEYSKEEKLIRLVGELADKLLRYYNLTSEINWQWFEDYLTYANSVIPEAMMYAYLLTNKKKYRKVAELTFDFVLSHYFMKGKLKVISNNGWFNKRNQRNFYGEQPIEVAYIIFSLELFYEVSGKSKYKDQLEIAFSWFLGNNHLHQIMYNPVNGGCYDGLEEHNVNLNQGAESSICYFMARLVMEKNNSIERSLLKDQQLLKRKRPYKWPYKKRTNYLMLKLGDQLVD